jgi:hypothetical protein
MKKTTLNTILATLIIVGIASALLISTQQNTISNPIPIKIEPIIRNDIVIYPSNLDANQDPLPKNSLSVQQILEKAEKHMTKEGYDLDEFKPRQLASYNSEGNIDYFFAQYNKETNSWRVAYQKLEPQSVTQDQFYFECYIDMNLDGSLINMHCSRLE